MSGYWIAFTGTRQGLTQDQRITLQSSLQELSYVTGVANVLHVSHGDAVGGDAVFDLFCRQVLPEARVHIYPAKTATNNRSFCGMSGDDVHEPKAPLTRNLDIIRSAHLLIACPVSQSDDVGGGTWHTVRLARDRNMLLRIIVPDGSYHDEGT